MNAAARALDQAYISTENLFELLFNRQILCTLLLFLILLFSAFGLVFLKDYHRRLMADFQIERMEYQQLKINQDRLLLEKSTWASPGRVEKIASQQMEMVFPNAETVMIVHLPKKNDLF